MEYEVDELFKTNSIFQLKELVVKLEEELLVHEEKLQSIVKVHKFPIIQSYQHLLKLGEYANNLAPLNSKFLTTSQINAISPDSPTSKQNNDELMMVNSTKVRLLLDLSEQLFDLTESDLIYNAALALRYSISLYDQSLTTQFTFLQSQWDTITNFSPSINQSLIKNISSIKSIDQFKLTYELVVGWCLNSKFSGSLGLSAWVEVKTSQLVQSLEEFNKSIAEEIRESMVWAKTSKLMDEFLNTLISSIYYTIHLFITHSGILWPANFFNNLKETYSDFIGYISETEFVPSESYDVQVTDILPPTALHHLIKRLPTEYHTISTEIIKDSEEALTIEWFDEFIDNWIDETFKRLRNDTLLATLTNLTKYPNLIPQSFNKFRELAKNSTEELFKSTPPSPSSGSPKLKRTKLEQTIFGLESKIWDDMLLPPLLKSSELGIHENLFNSFKQFNNNLIDQLTLINELSQKPNPDESEVTNTLNFCKLEVEFKSIEYVNQLIKQNLPLSNYRKYNTWLIQIKEKFENNEELINVILKKLKNISIRTELKSVIISERIELLSELTNNLQLCVDNSEFKTNPKLNCELSKVIQLVKDKAISWSEMDTDKIEWNKLIHKLEQIDSTSYRRWIHSTANWFMEEISYLFNDQSTYDEDLTDPELISSKLFITLVKLCEMIWESFKISWNETIRSSLIRELYYRIKLEVQTNKTINFNNNNMDFKFLSYLIYQGESDNSLPDEIKFTTKNLENSRKTLELVKSMEINFAFCINRDKLEEYIKELNIELIYDENEDYIPIAAPAQKFPFAESLDGSDEEDNNDN